MQLSQDHWNTELSLFQASQWNKYRVLIAIGSMSDATGLCYDGDCQSGLVELEFYSI